MSSEVVFGLVLRHSGLGRGWTRFGEKRKRKCPPVGGGGESERDREKEMRREESGDKCQTAISPLPNLDISRRKWQIELGGKTFYTACMYVVCFAYMAGKFSW